MILSGMVKAAVVAVAVAPSATLLTSPGNSPSLSLTQYRPDCVDGEVVITLQLSSWNSISSTATTCH